MAEEKVEKKVAKTTTTTKKETTVKEPATKVAPAKTTTKTTETKTAKPTATEVKVAAKPTAKSVKAPKVAKGKIQEFQGTGRRKSSVARVRISVGTGKIIVNGEELKEYFDLDTLVTIVKQPLVLTDTLTSVDVIANIYGGGKTGQAGAMRHGITRALIEFRPELRAELKKAGFVTRDARKKERKKYGLKKARRAPQFSKR